MMLRDHVGNLTEPEILKLGVWNRLSSLGIDAPSRKSRGRSKHISVTPCPSEKKRKNFSSIFGVSLRDLPKTRLELGEGTGIFVNVPEFLPRLFGLIYLDLGRVGVFRLSGSDSRQKAIRERLEDKDASLESDLGSHEMCVIDAAVILKQWLRELPEPIVPDSYQDVMLRCCSLASDDALILATCLLPETASYTLSYLCRFFLDVTLQSESNKMDARNLAIVLAPSLFPLANKKGGSLESTKNILNLKTQIVERLIINANQICIMDGPLAEEYSSAMLKMTPNFTSHSEDNLDSENPAGPSERRSRKKKKKHRRSGSLSRVITAFKGIISRSTTPAAARETSSRLLEDSSKTPDSFFSSPSLCRSKRKAALNSAVPSTVATNDEVKHSVEDLQHHPHPYYYILPPSSKIPKMETPKIRGKSSFSVKRFKKKKSLCKTKSVDSSTTLVNYSPLRSRICLLPRTPQTPDALAAAINANKDLSDDDEEELGWNPSSNGNKDRSSPSIQAGHSSAAQETISSGGSECSSLADTAPIHNDTSSRSLSNSLRRGQPNSINTGLAKPHAALVTNSSNRGSGSESKISSSSRLRREDSLASLKKDLSTLIESSFAAAASSESSSLSSLDEDSSRNVKEIIQKMKSVEMNSLSPLTRSQLRRQSSAFELALPDAGGGEEGGSKVTSNSDGGVLTRRQSSAFEKNEKQAMKRGEAFRASLARKNSSVKDLVRRIERSRAPSSSFSLIPENIPSLTLIPTTTEDTEEEENEEPNEQWMDASEFFKNTSAGALPPSNSLEEQLETPFEGCKRSSIIRIRNENRGKVSKSVETFTQTPASTSSRRVSARVGVATSATPFVTKRRQQTGIRTTTTVVKRQPPKTTPQTITAAAQSVEGSKPNNTQPKKAAGPSEAAAAPPRTRNKNRNKKNRRHLTIGYLGEPVGTRSPLKERVNVITVQRSKSAQNPTRLLEPSKKKKKRQNSSASENAPVQRSHSVVNTKKSELPMTLRDTLYDHQQSPKGERLVKRNLSDRVMTPTKGGLKNEAIPYMKSVRSANLGSTPPNKILNQNHKLSLNTTPVRKSPRLAKMY